MYTASRFAPEFCLPNNSGSKAVAQFSSTTTLPLLNDDLHTVSFTDASSANVGAQLVGSDEIQVQKAGTYLLWAQIQVRNTAPLIPGYNATSWFEVNGVPVAGAGGHVRALLTAQSGIIAQAVVKLARGDKIKLRASGVLAQAVKVETPTVPTVPAACFTITEV